MCGNKQYEQPNCQVITLMRVMKGRDELWTDEMERRADHMSRFIRIVERSRL